MALEVLVPDPSPAPAALPEDGRVRCEVRFQLRPAWLVGESDVKRTARRRGQGPARVAAADRYPGDYRGRIGDIRDVADVASGALPSLRHMASEEWGVVELDLDDADAAGAAARRLKYDPARGCLADVGMAEELGGAAEFVVSQFGGDWQAAEIAWGSRDDDNPLARKFLDCYVRGVRALPKTDTHTGTGIYCVKKTPTHSDDTQSGAPAGQVVTLTTGGLGTDDAWIGGYVTNATRSETRAIVSHNAGDVTLEGVLTNWLDGDDLDVYDAWSTVQGALDQLWADQGATTFTATQTVRIYSGTYAEAPVPNASLTETWAYWLVLQGAAGETVDIAPPTGYMDTYGQEYVELGNLTVSAGTLRIGASDYSAAYVHDCTCFGIAMLNGSYRLEDCTITTLGQQWSGQTCRMIARRCTIGTSVIYSGFVRYESCAFTGYSPSYQYTLAIGSGIGDEERPNIAEVVNCTFYPGVASTRPIIQLGKGEGAKGAALDVLLLNNIFQDGTYAIKMESPKATRLTSDFNRFYSQSTAVVRWQGADKTLAEWQALGYDEHSTEGDPGMTDPAGGDYSLTAASACRNAGAGAGVATGINDVAFDPHHPDIGAWSSGTWARPTAPTVAAADQANGWEITLTLVAGDSRDVLSVRSCKTSDSAWSTWGTTQTGSGDLSITGLDLARYEFAAYATRFGETSRDSDPAFETLTGNAPETATVTEIDNEIIGGKSKLTFTPGGYAEDAWVGCIAVIAGDSTEWPIVDSDADWVIVTGGVPTELVGAAITLIYPADSVPAPSGAVSLPLENVRNLLAASATFQALVGAADAGEAQGYITYPEVEGSSWTRPSAILDHAYPAPLHERAGRGGPAYAEEGEAEITIEAEIASAYRVAGQERHAWLAFSNVLGAIKTDMEAVAGTGGYLDATGFTTRTVERSDEETEKRGDFWYRGVIGVRWEA